MCIRRFVPLLFLVAAVSGCSQRADNAPNIQVPESLQLRAARRAYPGAPPVIPHPPLSSSCVTCHTPVGRVVPTIGIAPANPHTKTPGLSERARCKQCHVFRQTDALFVASSQTAFWAEGPKGSRAHPLAPPTIPHAEFMREDCNACHSGPAARPEIVCQHPERTRCGQCHVPQMSMATNDTFRPDIDISDTTR